MTNFSTPDGIIPEYDTELRKRGFGLLRQYNAIPEMKFLSQPPGTDVENLEDYVYLDYAGSNITVYVHDSGIYLKHEQFTLPRPPSVTAGKIEWLYPIRHGLKKFQKKKGQPTTDPTGHGTCVTSKIVGLTRGAAIGANVKMVPRINKKDDDWMLGGLEAIVKDIQKQKKALNGHFFPVVSLSYGYIWKKDKVHAKYRSFYKQMVDLGALLVVTAGNDRRNHANVTSYPALFAKEPDFEDSMLVVGSVDIKGRPSIFSQGGPLVKIWAPGTISCASPRVLMNTLARKVHHLLVRPWLALQLICFLLTESFVNQASRANW